MMEEYQIEQIMLKKEKLIDQLCIVSAVPFNCFMVTWEIWNSWVKMLHFFNVLVVVDLYSLKVYEITKANVTKNETILGRS